MGDMAGHVITYMLQKVDQVVSYYYNLQKDAKANLEELKKELALLEGLLKDTARNPTDLETLKVIEKDIRVVIYEAEDTIDNCLLQKKKSLLPFRKSTTDISLVEHVKAIREQKVAPLLQRVQIALKLAGEGSQTSSTRINKSTGEDGSSGKSGRKTSTSRINKDLAKVNRKSEKIVGFEEEEKTIIEFLRRETEVLDVFSIIGMAGLGKTTLAWKIFHNESLHYEFPTRIWVNVSQELNIKDVLLSILGTLSHDDMSGFDVPCLAQMADDYLKNRKYLLVLDDVWTPENWKAIRNLLPSSNNTGKVLVTSRHKSVGLHAQVNGRPHELRFLTGKESWTLLQLEVFGKLEACPKDLEDTGKLIAENCHGLPLSVVVIGGILVEHKSDQVNQIINAWTNIAKDSKKHTKEEMETNVKEVVGWSYNNLPDYLRGCFVYLGVFPEAYEIPTSTVIHLWISEGFVRGPDFEETAKKNLRELISRNLVMVEKTNPNGDVKTCRVHDVIRDFCILKSSDVDLFQEFKWKNSQFEPSISDDAKHRRICVHKCLDDFLLGTSKHQTVRSFLSFTDKKFNLTKSNLAAIPTNFRLLKVLEAMSFNFSEFPIDVKNLTNLRYLTLCCDSADTLPVGICELWNLQTLFINTNSPKLKIPGDIWKMVQLRHFKTKASITLSAKSITSAAEDKTKANQNLHTISRLPPNCCTQTVFRKAPNLRKLGVRGDIHILSDSEAFRELDFLENLKLQHDLDYGEADVNKLKCLPKSFPKNLKRLTLSGTYLDWSHMSTLGEIAGLQVLKLKDNAFSGMEWNLEKDRSFSTLQYLVIKTSDLLYWRVSGDKCFTKLTCLVINNCKKLNGIPSDVSNNLRVLDISRVSKTLVAAAEEIEKDKKKTQGAQDGWDEFKLMIGPESRDQR